MLGPYCKFPKNRYEVYDRMISDANEKYDSLISDNRDDSNFVMDSTFLENERVMYFYRNLRNSDNYVLLVFKTESIEVDLKNNKQRI